MRTFLSIEEAYLYAAEVQLATLQGVAMLKRTPKHEVKRHLSIATGMVTEIQRLIPHERLKELLDLDGQHFGRCVAPRVRDIIAGKTPVEHYAARS